MQQVFSVQPTGNDSSLVESETNRARIQSILAAAGRGNIDGEPIQGSLADFVARQAELVSPKTLILNHHDDWLPGFSIDTDMQPIRDELARRCPDVTLVEPGYVDGTVLF